MNRLYICGATLLVAVLSLSLFVSTAAAAPAGFRLETITGGLNLPTTMVYAPDGRLFIAEKNGTVRLFKNGSLSPTPVIKLSDVNDYSDHGLLGIALDPQFGTNGFMYLSYTFENTPGKNYEAAKTGRIVRVTVQGDTANEATKIVLVGTVGGDEAHPSCENYSVTADCIPSDAVTHSVGGLRFGPDGKLYATLGDGAGFLSVDPLALRAQNIDSLAGKLIRINTDGTAPADNPFYNGPRTNRSKVFAYGFRNPFRFTFRPIDGGLFVGDVGWTKWEEVDVIQKGGNYGWPCKEGFEATDYNCSSPQPMLAPIYVFDHSAGTAAVSGGAFPLHNVYPIDYMNSYYFGDVTGNTIKRMAVDGSNQNMGVENFFTDAQGPVDFVTGPDGYIYYLSIYKGELRRIGYSTVTTNEPPQVVLSAMPTTGPAPLTVHFSAAGTTDPEGDGVTYLWNLGDGTVSTSLTFDHTYTSLGTAFVTLTVKDTKGNQAEKAVEIHVGSVTGAANPHHVTTSMNPSPSYIGDKTTFTTTVRNDGDATPFIVDLEIYDAQNMKIAQQVFEKETIPKGGTKTYSLNWLPNTLGTYRVAVGLFQDNWTGLYEWTNEAVKFTVAPRIPTSQFTPTFQSASATPALITPGGTSVLSASIKNTGSAGSALIDLEVYKNGVKVAQGFTDNVAFAENETKNAVLNWKASESGTYSLSVGVFKPNWAGIYSWTNDAAKITVTGGSVSVIYDEGLIGWENWSWDGTYTIDSTDKAKSGGKSIKVVYNAPWAGLFLHATTPVMLGDKSALAFSISGATSGGQSLQVVAYDSAGTMLPAVPITSYLSAPISATSWSDVRIPLSALNLNGKSLGGFVIQGNSGLIEKPFYVDLLRVE
jgi:glucose/arabinose dehydrogenase